MNRLVGVLFALFLVAVPARDALRPDAFDWARRGATLLSSRADPADRDVFSALFPWLPPGDAFEDFEHDLEAASSFRRALRPRVQELASRLLGLGNAKVVLAPDGRLLHRPSLEYVVGPPFDRATEALIEWNAELARRGVALLVVPVPPKAATIVGDEVVHNVAWPGFRRALERAGVALLELAPTYLRTDTHWSPAGMETAAAAIAEALVARGWVEREPSTRPLRALDLERVGDLGRLLDERPESTWIRPDEVTIRAVPGWEPDPASPVLLLGDSFTNIYSLAAMGWGTRAGLAEHLSVALGFDVDRIAINGDGARASREALRLAGPERLAAKRVVVFQLAARELRYGDWTPVALP